MLLLLLFGLVGVGIVRLLTTTFLPKPSHDDAELSSSQEVLPLKIQPFAIFERERVVSRKILT